MKNITFGNYTEEHFSNFWHAENYCITGTPVPPLAGTGTGVKILTGTGIKTGAVPVPVPVYRYRPNPAPKWGLEGPG